MNVSESLTYAKAGDVYVRVEDVQAVTDGKVMGSSNIFLRQGLVVTSKVSAVEVMRAIDKAVQFR